MISGISRSGTGSRTSSNYKSDTWRAAIPITINTGYALFGEGVKPAFTFSLRKHWAKLYAGWKQRFVADATLHKISELTPHRIKTLGNIHGIIFDLDDTLMPILSGRFLEGTLPALKQLQKAGFQMGIVTNNIQPAYCRKVRAKLAEEGLALPFIEDAYKPDSLGFRTMQNKFNLKSQEIVVIGDGWFSDVVAAKALGMKSILARWTRQGLLSHQPFLFCWDAFVSMISYIRAVITPRKIIPISGGSNPPQTL